MYAVARMRYESKAVKHNRISKKRAYDDSYKKIESPEQENDRCSKKQKYDDVRIMESKSASLENKISHKNPNHPILIKSSRSV